MSLNQISAGYALPDDFNVIIEISANSPPVKYEVDAQTGAMFVDRFVSTAMHYPCNYGYVPKTLSLDGDAVDALVVTPFPIQTGSVIRCRPLAVLRMEDENGQDEKLLALPLDKICPFYAHIQSQADLQPLLLKQICHFFKHYKDLEENKWVKIVDWESREAAVEVLNAGVSRYQQTLKRNNGT